MREVVVLFDIDGTLVDTGGAGRRAIERAADRLHARPDLFEGIRFDGATDRRICRRALDKLDRPCQEPDIDALLESYLVHLAEELDRSAGYALYPGAEELVARLARAGALLGLGTGNVERGARLKLGRGGLNPHFPFGGFGDDAEDRAEIIRIGLRRAERRLGRPARETWVIGDTPLDLAAGRAAGARVVLVATGRFTAPELARHEPDLCVETLADPRIPRLLGVD